ncbi:MAG: arsenate reductase ArsC [bacterium]|jgi:arsenate reductase
MDTPSHKPLVLFLCTGNSARSQMAEVILRNRAGDRFEVASAGLEPKGVHPLTLQVLNEAGLPTKGLRSKSSTEFLGKVRVRHAIVVCEKANKSCPSIYPFAANMLYWPFEDPAAFEGIDEERLAKFREVRDLIAARIDEWLYALDTGVA